MGYEKASYTKSCFHLLAVRTGSRPYTSLFPVYAWHAVMVSKCLLNE